MYVLNIFLSLAGDLKNEEMVLEYLIDDDNRELSDEIETINLRMLNKLVEESPFLAVYFCKYFQFICALLDCPI